MIIVDGGRGYEVKYMQECISFIFFFFERESPLICPAIGCCPFSRQTRGEAARRKRETLHLSYSPHLFFYLFILYLSLSLF